MDLSDLHEKVWNTICTPEALVKETQQIGKDCTIELEQMISGLDRIQNSFC